MAYPHYYTRREALLKSTCVNSRCKFRFMAVILCNAANRFICVLPNTDGVRRSDLTGIFPELWE